MQENAIGGSAIATGTRRHILATSPRYNVPLALIHTYIKVQICLDYNIQTDSVFRRRQR